MIVSASACAPTLGCCAFAAMHPFIADVCDQLPEETGGRHQTRVKKCQAKREVSRCQAQNRVNRCQVNQKSEQANRCLAKNRTISCQAKRKCEQVSVSLVCSIVRDKWECPSGHHATSLLGVAGVTIHHWSAASTVWLPDNTLLLTSHTGGCTLEV
jgi:hypothetical protein